MNTVLPDKISYQGMENKRIQPVTRKEDREGKRFRTWMILFGVLILHFFCFPRLVPTDDVMGQEGLKRVIVQGIALLPAMFCLAGTVLAEGVIWFVQKKQKKAEVRRGMVMAWLVLLCVNVWWCVMETRNLLGAVQDWKVMEEPGPAQGGRNLWEREGVDQVSFQSWKIQESSSMGVTRGYYLKNAARTFSFPIGKGQQRKQSIENYEDQKLTVYYYHHSQVPIRICAGNHVLAEGK